jgi:WD40 repeat protein
MGKIATILFCFISVFVITLNFTEAQAGSDFEDQIFSEPYVINVHWDANGERTIAIRARPSRNIFILDDDFNVIANFDPLSDPTIPGGVGNVAHVDWNPTGSHLAVPVIETFDGSVLQIWDVRAGTFESFPFEPIVEVAWSPRGDFIAVVTEDGVIIWDVENKQVLHELNLPGIPMIQRANWKSDGSQIAVLNAQGMLRIWDVDTTAVIMELNAENASLDFDEITNMGKSRYQNIEWQPNSNRLAILNSATSMLEIWDTNSQSLVNSFPAPDNLWGMWWGSYGFVTNTLDKRIIW